MSRTGLHNLSGLGQFDKFVLLAHFPVSKKRTTAHLRTPFHYFQLTSRALTVSLLLPDSEKFPHGSLVSLLFLRWLHTNFVHGVLPAAKPRLYSSLPYIGRETKLQVTKWPELVAKYQVQWTKIMINTRLDSSVRIKTRIRTEVT